MAAQTNNFSQVFKLLRRARAGHSIKTSLVKDREGHIINNESCWISWWMEHVSNLLHHHSVSLDLLGRLLPAIRSCRRPQQAGFMSNRSTIDQISALRLIIEKTREFVRAVPCTLLSAIWKLRSTPSTTPRYGQFWHALACLARS